MKSILNKRNLFFIVLIFLILVWIDVVVHKKFSNINFGDYAKFYALAKILATTITLCAIMVFIWIPTSTLKSVKPNIRIWLFAFLFTLFLGIGLVLIGNPDGRFPWGNAHSYLRVGGRTLKPRMFIESQKGKPFEIIVLGSSRAFSISTQTLEENLNANAFNMSVESATSIDIFGLTNFVIENQAETPKVLLVEVAAPVINNHSWETKATLSLVQYLPVEKSVLITWNIIKSAISLSRINDSVYALATTINSPSPGIFEEGGYLIQKIVTNRQYKANLISTKGDFERLQCSFLDKEGVEYIERLVELAREKNISVVFYRSPVNKDILKMVPAYVTCDRLMKTYFDQLQQQHNNVFFQDLAYYKPISNLHKVGFRDSWHLTSLSADIVVEALTPKLKAALEWAQKSRE